jgi:hypothetical protein
MDATEKKMIYDTLLVKRQGTSIMSRVTWENYHVTWSTEYPWYQKLGLLFYKLDIIGENPILDDGDPSTEEEYVIDELGHYEVLLR